MESAGEKRSEISGHRTPGGSLPARIFLLLLFLPGYFSKRITWLPNLEWDTASNWANNFVPQNGTRVVFPVEMRLSVGLPATNYPLDLAGLDLPRDGALALPQTGVFTISEAKPSVKTAEWSLEGPLLWVDPDNWAFEKSSRAIPHLERIPCQDDVVELPSSKRTISIQLPNTMGTRVKAVRVKDDTGNLPSWEWTSLVEPQREFSSGPMSVRYSGVQSCLDCSCQPESIGRQIIDEVCKTRGARCPDQECEYPMTIEGNCCYYCGGRITLQKTTSVSLAKTVANLALEKYGSTLAWHARRTWDSKTEILITGRTKYSETNTADGISALTSVLQEQGIKFVSVETTGHAVEISKWAALFGIFFGTLLLAIVLVLAAIPYYGYSLPQVLGESWRGLRQLTETGGSEVLGSPRGRNWSWKSIRFAKFENAPDAEVELATSASEVPVVHPDVDDDDDEIGAGGGGGRFANPLYRSGRKQPEVQTFAALQKLHEADHAAVDEVDLSIE